MGECSLSKKCSKCGVEKHVSEFSKARDIKSGIRGVCRACQSVSKRRWDLANTERKKSYAVAWHVSNKDKQNSLSAAWRAANQDRVKESFTAWYAANKDKRSLTISASRSENLELARLRESAYRAENPEMHRTAANNRRARKLKAGGTLSQGLSAKLFKLQKGKCPCCKQSLGDDYHLDHKMPLALGGSNTDDNIQLLRSICNKQKHAKHPVAFMQSRGFLL